MIYRPNRLALYKELGTEALTFEDFCRQKFFHPVSDALRLSLAGVQFLEENGLKAHAVDMIKETKKSEIPSKHYIFLAKYCRKPYYIGSNKIYFFDEEEAFLFKMCDGDIENVSQVAPEIFKTKG